MSNATRAPDSPGIGATANGFSRRHSVSNLTHNLLKAAS